MAIIREEIASYIHSSLFFGLRCYTDPVHPHMGSSSKAQLCKPHVLGLIWSFSISVILSGHCQRQIKMTDSSRWIVLMWRMILDSSSALSLFVEGKGNAAYIFFRHGCACDFEVDACAENAIFRFCSRFKFSQTGFDYRLDYLAQGLA